MNKIESNCVGCSKENVCKYAEKNDEIRDKLNNVISEYETNIFSAYMICACFEKTKPTFRNF